MKKRKAKQQSKYTYKFTITDDCNTSVDQIFAWAISAVEEDCILSQIDHDVSYKIWLDNLSVSKSGIKKYYFRAEEV